MPDIFLSYSREDQSVAGRFAGALEQEGLSVWWDQTLRTGEAYDRITEQALRDAHAVVVLWSRTSVESRWVRAEATTADRRGTLLPAMIEPCERPIMFELIQTADLSSWKGDRNDPLWRTFVADVRGHSKGRPFTQVPAPTSPAVDHTPQRTHAATRDAKPSLAILPFTNRSGAVADDVFADGMVEDIISALSLSGELKVIARSATVALKGNISDLRTVGRELGVRYLLEGNVRRAGANLRVTAQLVNAEDAGILWTQRFEYPLSELSALQEQLVQEVASHLNVQVARFETVRALRKPDDLTAWEAVMRSRSAFAENLTSSSAGDGIAEARRAVAIDPDYALGRAQLGHTLASHYMSMGATNPKQAIEARTHAERALALDPNDATVLASAAIAIGYTKSWQAAMNYASKSLEINPNQMYGHVAFAMACIHCDRTDEALQHLQHAEALAPSGLMSFVTISIQGLVHFQAGRLEEALRAVDRSLLRNPMFLYSLANRACYLARLGRMQEAVASLAQLHSKFPAVTPDSIEAAYSRSFMSPTLSADLSAAFRSVWAAAGFPDANVETARPGGESAGATDVAGRD